MNSRVWIDATMTLELNRRQIEALDHLASYGAGLVRAIRQHVTSEVSEDDLLALFNEAGRQAAPVVRAIHAAEKKLRAEPMKPARAGEEAR